MQSSSRRRAVHTVMHETSMRSLMHLGPMIIQPAQIGTRNLGNRKMGHDEVYNRAGYHSTSINVE